MGFISWTADYADPSDFIDNLFGCDAFLAGSPNNNNLSEYCNPATDALIAKAEALEVADPQAASRLWARGDRQLVDRALYAPMYVPRGIDFVSKRVGNYRVQPPVGLSPIMSSGVRRTRARAEGSDVTLLRRRMWRHVASKRPPNLSLKKDRSSGRCTSARIH